ncbi:uncharacterized protein SETTUDRAFT_93166 [Exserohilum turcica Et28A]|uniref:Uncharacterized protein n=1 Tax=Exserohilum turcicum (strain 28A) TaxID=671987 RepID=R0K406_EXST2|nr:uncharacterized protein SETTUDRAFT_93166 [Exserohilum turcica Et28A]EOA84304.1 hypothetical protein SETTUDRAFT_93166 [Exserohilum turcica Et28A]
MAPNGPFKLVTVNTAPKRAKILIGRVVDILKDEYTIEYVANCSSKDEVAGVVETYRPDVLVN